MRTLLVANRVGRASVARKRDWQLESEEPVPLFEIEK
jgi:hypothetical protein